MDQPKNLIKKQKPKKEKRLTRKQFMELIGEDPVDVLGNDWENSADDFNRNKDPQNPNNCLDSN